jgi:hypothetical protein
MLTLPASAKVVNPVVQSDSLGGEPYLLCQRPSGFFWRIPVNDASFDPDGGLRVPIDTYQRLEKAENAWLEFRKTGPNIA